MEEKTTIYNPEVIVPGIVNENDLWDSDHIDELYYDTDYILSLLGHQLIANTHYSDSFGNMDFFY